MGGTGVIRFKRSAYNPNDKGYGDKEPLWHIAAHPYRKGALYKKYVAMCGYEVETPWLRGAVLSIARTVRGPVCTKCKRKWEKGMRVSD